MPGSTIGRSPALDSKLESGIVRQDCIYGQFHESVNLGVKILKWSDSHFYILISQTTCQILRINNCLARRQNYINVKSR